MKKSFLAFMAVVAIALVSCEKESRDTVSTDSAVLKRVITLKAPDFGGRDITPGIAGSFAGCEWSEAAEKRVAMNLDDGVWTATVEMADSDEFKICSLNDSWNIEPQYYDESAGKWKKFSNTQVGDVTKFDFDYSNGDLYRWTPDSIPAGHGKFFVNALYDFSEGDRLIFAGNFDNKPWADSDREMVYDGQSDAWIWEGDYPKNFEYKVFIWVAGGTQTWADGDNVIFDGVHFEHTFDF